MQSNSSDKSSHSLREQHRAVTRALIMKTLAEIVAEQGVHSFTVQGIADRAGVSHRTIYRHFPTRESLLSELAEWLDEQLRHHGAPGSPTTLEEGISSIPMIFNLFDKYDVLVRALVIIYATTQIRPPTREERTESFARVLREAIPHASEQEQRWLFGITRALANTQTWFFFRYYLGMSGEEAGQAVEWAVKTLVAEVSEGHGMSFSNPDTEGKSKGSGEHDKQSSDG